MSDLKKYLDKQLANPAFAKEYEKQRSEYKLALEKIRIQNSSNPQSTIHKKAKINPFQRPVITGRFSYVQNQLHNHKTSF